MLFAPNPQCGFCQAASSSGSAFFYLVNAMTTRNIDQQSGRPRIVITTSDHARLTTLAQRAVDRDSEVGHYLADELSRAHIVADDACAETVVRMGSRVTYTDDATNKTRTVTLVYPHEADVERNRISVLTPIGAALIGLSASQSIQWLNPSGGMSTLSVIEVSNESAEAAV